MFKKKLMLIVFIIIITCIQIFAQAKYADNFKIRAGVNISHWLSQSLERGEERAKYITAADFDSIASAGFDHVRIPVDEVQLWDSSGNKHKDAFDLLHNAIKWALKNNLRVIVDLHIIRSFYFNAASNPLWTNKAAQQKLIKMWMQLSEELHQYPDSMVAYEILNEPTAKNPEDWNIVLNKVLKAIREKEPKRIVVIGSNMWQNAGTFPELRFPQNDFKFSLLYSYGAYSSHCTMDKDRRI
jgi:endoglucanase